MTDSDYLKRAIALAAKSSEPVKCACVLVKDGEIVAETFNSQRADGISTHHAEIKALAVANRRLQSRKLLGVTAYCSCEPCIMCLSAMSIAQVERIVYFERMSDVAPNDPMSRLDSADFAAKYLPFTPKLEHLVLS